MLRKSATKNKKQQVTKSVYNYYNIFIIIAICLKLKLLDEIQSNVSAHFKNLFLFYRVRHFGGTLHYRYNAHAKYNDG